MSRQPNEWQRWWLLRKNSYREILKYSLGLTPQAHLEEAVMCELCRSTRSVHKGRSQCKVYSGAGTAVGDLWKMDKPIQSCPTRGMGKLNAYQSTPIRSLIKVCSQGIYFPACPAKPKPRNSTPLKPALQEMLKEFLKLKRKGAPLVQET